jgi:RHS repeat-associated protein
MKMGGSYAGTSLPQALASSSHNDGNQLTQRGTATLTYDEAGNLTGDGANTYTWNARNQLTGISGSVSASFQYDAFGRRISKTINSSTTSYVYDGVDAVQEQAGGIVVANMLVGGVDEVLTRTDSAGEHHLLSDGLGSTLALTDSIGTAQTQYTYDPFGSSSQSGATSGNPSQYTGRENDETGFYYYRARYYSPALQRFISEDPLGFASGETNFYGYVGNNPANKVDPSGLDDADREWEERVNAKPSPSPDYYSNPWYWSHNESADNDRFERSLAGRQCPKPNGYGPEACGSYDRAGRPDLGGICRNIPIGEVPWTRCVRRCLQDSFGTSPGGVWGKSDEYREPVNLPWPVGGTYGPITHGKCFILCFGDPSYSDRPCD